MSRRHRLIAGNRGKLGGETGDCTPKLRHGKTGDRRENREKRVSLGKTGKNGSGKPGTEWTSQRPGNRWTVIQKGESRLKAAAARIGRPAERQAATKAPSPEGETT